MDRNRQERPIWNKKSPQNAPVLCVHATFSSTFYPTLSRACQFVGRLYRYLGSYKKSRFFSKAIIQIILLLFFNASFAYQHNICLFFKKHPDWYWTTQAVQRKWGVPISVQMAVMEKESHFRAEALTPRRKLFGFIPWFRKSSAEGYAQALDETWHRYIQATHKMSGDRTHFSDADDFLGWYAHLIYRHLSIHATDAFRLYLAYHEGVNGYREQRYRDKPALITAAHQVEKNAKRYHYQLIQCQHMLPKKPWWHYW